MMSLTRMRMSKFILSVTLAASALLIPVVQTEKAEAAEMEMECYQIYNDAIVRMDFSPEVALMIYDACMATKYN